MNVKQACSLLQLPDDFDQDDLQDAFDQQVFDLKNYFLSNAILAKLFDKRLEQLAQLASAYAVLGGTEQAETEPAFKPFLASSNLQELIPFYEKEMAKLKTGLSKSNCPSIISSNVRQMLLLQAHFEDTYLQVFNDFVNKLGNFEGRYNAEVKITKNEDTAILKQALMACGISDKFYFNPMQSEAHLYTCLSEAYRIYKLRQLK